MIFISIDDFYEKVRLMCLFYNARINYESNKKGLKIVLAVVSVVVLLIVGYFVISNVKGNDFQDDNITYVIRR